MILGRNRIRLKAFLFRSRAIHQSLSDVTCGTRLTVLIRSSTRHIRPCLTCKFSFCRCLIYELQTANWQDNYSHRNLVIQQSLLNQFPSPFLPLPASCSRMSSSTQMVMSEDLHFLGNAIHPDHSRSFLEDVRD